jgi:hypothetical protein
VLLDFQTLTPSRPSGRIINRSIHREPNKNITVFMSFTIKTFVTENGKDFVTENGKEGSDERV